MRGLRFSRGVIGLTLLAFVLVVHEDTSAVSERPSPPPRGLAACSPEVVEAREAIIQRTLGLRAEVLRADRVEAKLTTPEAYVRAHLPDSVGSTETDQIWAVAVSGVIDPMFARQFYRSGVWWFSDSGEPIGMHANANEDWPAFFDSLPTACD